MCAWRAQCCALLWCSAPLRELESPIRQRGQTHCTRSLPPSLLFSSLCPRLSPYPHALSFMNVTSILGKFWIYQATSSFPLLLSGCGWTQGWCQKSLKDSVETSRTLSSIIHLHPIISVPSCGADTSGRTVSTSSTSCALTLSWLGIFFRWGKENKRNCSVCWSVTPVILGTWYSDIFFVAPLIQIRLFDLVWFTMWRMGLLLNLVRQDWVKLPRISRRG